MNMRTYVYVDGDNVTPKLAIYACKHLAKTHDVLSCDIFISTESKEYRQMEGNSKWHIFRCPKGKNSSDLWLTMHATEAICQDSHMDKLIILSGDRDFLPLAWFAVKHDIKVAMGAKNCSPLQNQASRMSLQGDIEFFALTEDALQGKSKSTVMKMLFNKNYANIAKYLERQWNGRMVLFHGENQTRSIPFIEGYHEQTLKAVLKCFGLTYQRRTFQNLLSKSGLMVVGHKIVMAKEA